MLVFQNNVTLDLARFVLAIVNILTDKDCIEVRENIECQLSRTFRNGGIGLRFMILHILINFFLFFSFFMQALVSIYGVYSL